jgi:hypothetical protein
VQSKKCILTQHHLGKDQLHWVSLVVDGEHDIVCYGDSFGNYMPSDLPYHNSLEHFAFPESVPLLACSGIQVARMSCFILASQQILAQVHTSD